MKTYKVILGGRGAEIYIHPINDEKKEKLKEMDVENQNVAIDWDKLNEVLEVENWDYSDDVYMGTYESPESYHISVYNESGEEVFSSDDDFYMNEGGDPNDYELKEFENVLIIENSVKGNFKEYILTTEEEFNPEKLTPVVVEINEAVSVIKDLKYDNKELELDEYGDNWSKGAFFYIF